MDPKGGGGGGEKRALGRLCHREREEEETRSPGSEMGGDENGDEKETNSKT